MNEFDIVIPGFQAFYVSREESNCPLLPEIVKTGKKLKDLGILENIETTSISMKYGKRVLMNAKNTDIRDIIRKDFLEIVDYDPVKKVILTMGPKEPRLESSIHWFIHHAREEVNAVIMINDVDLSEKFSKKLPVTEKEYSIITLEQIKEILKILRNSKKLVIKNKGVLFVGNSMGEAEKLVIDTFEEFK